jgi:hypothetical protein
VTVRNSRRLRRSNSNSKRQRQRRLVKRGGKLRPRVFKQGARQGLRLGYFRRRRRQREPFRKPLR